MNFSQNPLQRTALIWGILILVGFCGIIAPFVFGMDGPGGGFALAFISMIFTAGAIVATIIYSRMAQTASNFLKGENLLAHWRYSPEEWKSYTENQFTVDKSNKKTLFIILVVIAVIVAVVFLIINREAGVFVALVLLAVVGLVGLVAYATTRVDHSDNLKHQGEAFIGRNGVYLNRRLHIWKGLGSRLEGVTFEEGKVPILKFAYSTLNGTARAYYSARVPIPAGEEETAKQIASEIGGGFAENPGVIIN